MNTFSLIRHRFKSKFHEENSSRFRRFWKVNPRGNYDIDSTGKFRRSFDFQNWQNIAESSTWIFLCCFDVESAWLLYSLFPFYHFGTISALGTYFNLVFLCNFNDDVIIDIDIETIGTNSFENFTTTKIIMN